MFQVSRCVTYSPGGGCEEESCQRTVAAGQARCPGPVFNPEQLAQWRPPSRAALQAIWQRLYM